MRDIGSLEGTPENVNISITGYDSQGRAWGYNITCRDNFNSRAVQLATNGLDTMCAIPFKEGNDNRFDELLEKHNQETTNPKELGLKAFTEMIRDYEAQDMIVGGEIFSITLRPK